MRRKLTFAALAASLALSGAVGAEDQLGASFGVGVGRVDSFHDHALDCGCTVRCRYYGGSHHYEHKHRPVQSGDADYGNRYDGGYAQRCDRDAGYDDGYTHLEDPYSRVDYWHWHRVGYQRYLHCHVVGRFHYWQRQP